jgi:hypothetical protein
MRILTRGGLPSWGSSLTSLAWGCSPMAGECYADTLNVCHMVADGDCEPRLEMCIEEAQLHPELSDVRTLEDLVRNSGRLFQELKVMRHPFFIEMLEDELCAGTMELNHIGACR